MADDNAVASEPASLMERLNIKEYSANDCLASIRGERLPHALGLSLTRLCVIRGIRYHYGFAQDLYRQRDEFTRALHARDIMSNMIPDMDLNRPEEFPYCIWHPNLAAEATYRDLSRRYPQMAYHVGRACAVAGYTDLYLELDILPEVHIAEEARDCGSVAIFDAIMANPVKYNVMDDYTRSVDIANPRPAFLNGDTAVRSSLEVKQKYRKPKLDEDEDDDDGFYMFSSDPGYHKTLFNITEDLGIDEHEIPKPKPMEDVTPLLYTPLPLDLPTMEKDLLILMAAFYGDVDRYARLRRPVMVEKEINCVVRGIYHNTMFAKWWSLQSFKPKDRIQNAITARFIMNNDLSHVTSEVRLLPYLIWYPNLASWTTYKELARLKPEMKPQILRACIIGDFEALFDELVNDVAPDAALVAEASASFNPHYLKTLEKRVSDLDITLSESIPYWHGWKKYSRQDNIQNSSNILFRLAAPDQINTEFDFIYDGYRADASAIELNVSVADEWKPNGDRFVELDYVDWPPKDESSREEEDPQQANESIPTSDAPEAPDTSGK